MDTDVIRADTDEIRVKATGDAEGYCFFIVIFEAEVVPPRLLV